MSSVFLARQQDSSDELFASFWAQFELEEGKSVDVYDAKNWKITDALYRALKLHFNEIPKSTIDGITDSSDPEFVGIAGTDLSYAVNTSKPFLMWNNSYYLVEEAVWYHSSTPYGPWQIASYRPEGVEHIPAGMVISTTIIP